MRPLFSEEIFERIAPIIHDGDFQRLKNHRQHLFFNRFEHLIHTAWIAERLARWTGAHVETCVLSALLHDYHHTRIRGHEHGIIAEKNARRFRISAEVASLVRAHMFPLGMGKVRTPFTKHFLILKVSDFSAACIEITFGFLFFSWKHSEIRFEKTRSIVAMTKVIRSVV